MGEQNFLAQILILAFPATVLLLQMWGTIVKNILCPSCFSSSISEATALLIDPQPVRCPPRLTAAAVSPCYDTAPPALQHLPAGSHRHLQLWAQEAFTVPLGRCSGLPHGRAAHDVWLDLWAGVDLLLCHLQQGKHDGACMCVHTAGPTCQPTASCVTYPPLLPLLPLCLPRS